MNIQPKYNIGDKVFYSGTTVTQKQHDCPDCLGSRQWTTTSPAGTDYTFDCPRCADGYISNRALSLKYSEYEPYVRELTIGSARMDTSDVENPISYMCVETGIGSGTVYDEYKLHPDYKTAEEVSKIRAKTDTQNNDFMVERYNESLSLSNYQLSNAELESSRGLESKLRSKYSWLISDLDACYDMEDLRKIILKLESFVEAA